MSERGAFVTEYMYCKDCLAAAEKVLLQQNKGLCSTKIPSWSATGDPALPIIAGKLGGMYSGEEVHMIEYMKDELEPQLCHRLTIAVIPDSAEPAFVVFAGKKKPKE